MSVTTTLSIAERTAISQGLTTQDEIELFHLLAATNNLIFQWYQKTYLTYHS